MSTALCKRGLCAQGDRKCLRVDVRLGDVERQLGTFRCTLEVAAEPVPDREASREQRKDLVWLIGRDDGEGTLHLCQRLVATAREGVEHPESRHDASRGVRVALLLVDLDRLLEEPAGGVGVAGPRSSLAGVVEERRPHRRRLRQARRLLEVAACLRSRTERPGALAGAGEHDLGLLPRLGRVIGVRYGLVGGEVVGGDDLDHLVVVCERLDQVLGGREVADPPFALRKCLVRDVAHEVLEEPVLPVLGRTGVCLNPEHLLADERTEERLDPGIAPRECRECVESECLTEHGRVLEQPPLLWRQPVEPGCDQGVQRLRHLERLDRPRQPVRGALLHEQAAVEQHPYGLDRVERDTFGPRRGSDPARRRAGPARDRPAVRPSRLPGAARGRSS